MISATINKLYPAENPCWRVDENLMINELGPVCALVVSYTFTCHLVAKAMEDEECSVVPASAGAIQSKRHAVKYKDVCWCIQVLG